MMQLADKKNIVEQYQVTDTCWEELGVPKEIIKGLMKISYNNPSRIQVKSLTEICKDTTKNYFF